MKGVPQVSNCLFIPVEELQERWGVGFDDILDRTRHDGLRGAFPKENPFPDLKFTLVEHIWPYEEEHPELKEAAAAYYEKVTGKKWIPEGDGGDSSLTEGEIVEWNPKAEGDKLKEQYNKVPKSLENQTRDLLAYFMFENGLKLPDIQVFFDYAGSEATISGWKKSGELIWKRLVQKKKAKENK